MSLFRVTLLFLLSSQWTLAQIYPIAPVPFTQVTVQPGFWYDKIETNRTITMPFGFKKCEETGRIGNFAVAGGLKQGTFEGTRYNDSDVYKMIEGASYSLKNHPDAELDRYVDNLIAMVAAAQEPDGYIYTIRTILREKTGVFDWTAGPTRYSFENGSHELFLAGHLHEAGVAHFLATGKRTLLDVAIKNANHLVNTFGPDKQIIAPGHQEIEMSLVKLYQITGDKRYVDLARFMTDMRGRGDKRPLFLDDAGLGPVTFQDSKPVVQQTEATGHTVRAVYMYAGMTDLAGVQQDTAYKRTVTTIWNDVTQTKQYITGGVGSRGRGEAFGNAYELPNDLAYSETCGSVATMLWNQRMFLLTGDSKYMDVFERVLYNSFMAGVSVAGNSFFYVNRLSSDGKNNDGWPLGRSDWFGTSCCPTNVIRFLPSLPGYMYAQKDNSLFVNLFASNSASVTVGTNPVKIEQATTYPWDGAVKMTLTPTRSEAFALRIRIPGWVQNTPMPGGLYAYLDQQVPGFTLTVNGKTVTPAEENGYAVVNRVWAAGDVVDLNLAMPVRQVVATSKIAADVNKVAFERGPVVYCAEGVDNRGQALSLSVPTGVSLTSTYQKDKLGGIVSLQTTGLWFRPTSLTLIPYYAWANRGSGEMAVWLNQTK